MSLFPLDEIADYWRRNKLFPYHSVTRYIARDRFQELYIRYRVTAAGHKELWDRVSPMSRILIIL